MQKRSLEKNKNAQKHEVKIAEQHASEINLRSPRSI